MHVLTKIFTVLVAMLATLLVPLVVVYTHNEDSFKTRYERADAQKAAATVSLTEAEARHGAESNRLENAIAELRSEKRDLEKGRVDGEAEIRRLESRLASEQSMKAEISAKLSTLATAVEASQDLTDSLVNEVRGLRSDSLTLERQKIELDEALRDVNGQLEVAIAARRMLQEQLQQLKDELADATTQLGEAYARGFNPRDTGRGPVLGLAPTKNLDAIVLGVRRSNEEVLAEIDAGSVDGIEVDWVMTIARGGKFKGKLRIVNVDVSRATGIVTLESASDGRTVSIGDTAYARIGQD